MQYALYLLSPQTWGVLSSHISSENYCHPYTPNGSVRFYNFSPPHRTSLNSWINPIRDCNTLSTVHKGYEGIEVLVMKVMTYLNNILTTSKSSTTWN